ncbi:MAG: PKD domain-containing protein, partial [Chitinophagales bacterium]|nr:PKD domain-containing protein [Chitinophagales bacterium]
MLIKYLRSHFPVFFFLFLFNTTCLYAQQDCITAIPICQDVYFELNSYDSVGDINELIGGFNTSCINGGEDNSVWYIFTVASAGSFEFQITPNVMNDDYDWTIFDLTNSDCSSIINGTAPEVRCNYSAIPGSTGLSNPYTQTSVPQGGPNQCAPMNVLVGETYVLMVNNFAGSEDGYTLTLSGTAVIFDTIPPKAVGIDPFPCYPPDTLHVTFSEPVTCISIAPDGSDFKIYGPSSPTIIAANSVNCVSGLFTTDIYLVLAAPITVNGDYTLRFQLGSNGNIVLDNCGNEMSFLDSLPFTVAIADAQFDYLLGKTCFGDSVVFFNTSIGDTINSITWDFGDGTGSTDFNPTHNYAATGSYTVTLSIADTGGCFDETSVQINAYVEPPVASFSVSSPPYCVNVPVSFTNSSTGQGLSSEWQFGTAGTTNEQDPDFSFLNEGLFTVLLIATDSIGCADTALADVPINA